MDTIGERIFKLRREKGLTQDDIAETLNISRQAVSRWERDLSMPETANLIDLSRLLGCNTDYLLSGETSYLQEAPIADAPLQSATQPKPQQIPNAAAYSPAPTCLPAMQGSQPQRLHGAIKLFLSLLIISVLALGTTTAVFSYKLKAAKEHIDYRYKLIQQQEIQSLVIDIPCKLEIAADDNYYYDSDSLYKWLYADGVASLVYDEGARDRIVLNTTPDTVRLRIPKDKAPAAIEIINRSEDPRLQIGESLTVSGLDLPSTQLKIDDCYRNVKIENCNFASFEIKLSNKDIMLNNVSVIGKTKFADGNGNLEIDGCVFNDDISIDTRADTYIKNSRLWGKGTFTTSNGDYHFINTTTENLYLEVGNGSIQVDRLFAKEVRFASSTGSLSGDFGSLSRLYCPRSALLDLDITLPQSAQNYTFISVYKPKAYPAVGNPHLTYAGKDYAINQNNTVGSGDIKIILEVNTCRVNIRTAD